MNNSFPSPPTDLISEVVNTSGELTTVDGAVVQRTDYVEERVYLTTLPTSAPVIVQVTSRDTRWRPAEQPWSSAPFLSQNPVHTNQTQFFNPEVANINHVKVVPLNFFLEQNFAPPYCQTFTPPPVQATVSFFPPPVLPQEFLVSLSLEQHPHVTFARADLHFVNKPEPMETSNETTPHGEAVTSVSTTTSTTDIPKHSHDAHVRFELPLTTAEKEESTTKSETTQTNTLSDEERLKLDIKRSILARVDREVTKQEK